MNRADTVEKIKEFASQYYNLIHQTGDKTDEIYFDTHLIFKDADKNEFGSIAVYEDTIVVGMGIFKKCTDGCTYNELVNLINHINMLHSKVKFSCEWVNDEVTIDVTTTQYFINEEFPSIDIIKYLFTQVIDEVIKYNEYLDAIMDGTEYTEIVGRLRN